MRKPILRSARMALNCVATTQNNRNARVASLILDTTSISVTSGTFVCFVSPRKSAALRIFGIRLFLYDMRALRAQAEQLSASQKVRNYACVLEIIYCYPFYLIINRKSENTFSYFVVFRQSSGVIDLQRDTLSIKSVCRHFEYAFQSELLKKVQVRDFLEWIVYHSIVSIFKKNSSESS